MVYQWFDALDRVDLSGELLSDMRANPRIHELAVNPMLLSLIVLVQFVRGLIPDKRHLLYEDCIKILVERATAPGSVQQAYNREVPSQEALFFLRLLASKFHHSRRREIPRDEVIDTLIPEVLAMMPTSQVAQVDPGTVLSNIERRSQLLVERGFDHSGNPLIAFSHMTFQEYLTALALIDTALAISEPNASQQLITRYENDPEWWEEVALLYSAQLTGVSQSSFFDRLFSGNSTVRSSEK